jgi:hypothetical protein
MGESEIKYPDKITIAWLYHNVPAKLWIALVGVLLSAFLAGLFVGETHLFSDIHNLFIKNKLEYNEGEDKTDMSSTAKRPSANGKNKNDIDEKVSRNHIEQHTEGDKSPAINSEGDVNVSYDKK